MDFLRKLTSLAVAASLVGCAAFPAGYDKPITVGDIAKEQNDAWSSMPALSYATTGAGVPVRRYDKLPASLANKKVKISLQADAEATVDDLLYALRSQGYNVVSRLTDTAETDLMTPTFEGKLGDFLDYFCAVHNVAYEYRNGLIFIMEAARYSVSLPQQDDLMTQVAKSLEEMGASSVRKDLQAGLVYYMAKPDIAEEIKNYLSVLSENSAMVTLQVAVLTVTLNRGVSVGFDWSKMAVSRGDKDFSPALTSNSGTNGTVTPSTGSGSSGTGSTGTTGGTGTAVEVVKKVGSLLSYAGAEGFAYKFVNDTFSLSAAIKALSTYGDARTEQNVILGTLSGVPVKISSGNEIPYVKSISATTTQGSSNVTGASETATVETGLKLDVVPQFDASDYSVVTGVKVDMTTLVGFRELSAGVNLGTLSQPELQKLEFENIGRLNAGETIVIGGITYDQLSDNYTNLPGLETKALGSKSSTVNRHAIYIVIRPTVVMFTKEPAKHAEHLAGQSGRSAVPFGKGSPSNASDVQVMPIEGSDGLKTKELPAKEVVIGTKEIKKRPPKRATLPPVPTSPQPMPMPRDLPAKTPPVPSAPPVTGVAKAPVKPAPAIIPAAPQAASGLVPPPAEGK